MGDPVNYDEHVRYLVEQPLGTVVILDSHVFSKTLDLGRTLGWDGKADRWYSPRDGIYFDGVEMAKTVISYGRVGRFLVVIG